MIELDDVQSRVLTALLGMQRQSWEQGVLSHVAIDLGLDDLAAAIAIDAVTRQLPDGRLAEIDGGGLVNSASALELLLARGDGAAVARQLDWLATGCPRADDGTLFHLQGSREHWVDSVYMLVPSLVAAGRVDFALQQFEGHRKRLFDERSGLWAARFDESAGTLSHPELWATGNGWVVAGLARAIRLGGANPQTRALAEHAQRVCDAMLGWETSTGALHNVVDDTATFTDRTSALMLAYAIATGIADGWMPDHYADRARAIVAHARDDIDAAGFVLGVCGAPHFDKQGTSAEAQAFFLLASAAVSKLS